MTPGYIDLLSPEPIILENTVGIICPTLRQIQQIGYDTYQLYLSVILMTPQSYYSMFSKERMGGVIENASHKETSIYELIIGNPQLCLLAERALTFFLTGYIRFSPEYKCFFLYENKTEKDMSKKSVAILNKDIWQPLCHIIAQRNYVTPSTPSTPIKSQKARKRLERLEQLRPKHKTVDKNMDIGNIISAVAGKSPSLNLSNIWDITIYQLWDTFYRLCNNHILNIQSMSVAAWGDQNHTFDSTSWFKNLREH